MISVCLATYNGEKFIKKQINSILSELSLNDEVIIVDDCSNDNTLNIIYNIDDARIKVFKNTFNLGHVKSFSKAIEASIGDFVFMSDQDDIWKVGRVKSMLFALNQKKVKLVTSNFVWINEFDSKIHIPFDGVSSRSSEAYFNNIVDIFIGKTNYFGCAMAFKRDLVPLITPIPSYVESHDLWIALAGNLLKANCHIDDITLFKRRHTNNTTSTKSNRNYVVKINSRIIFIFNILHILFRRIKSL
jgi:glycosyltransferase involved in cell wall biosynthesis